MPVQVPKMHPLFNLESDDPLPIPDILGHSWVAKAYGKGSGGTRGLQNPMAKLLFTRLNVKDGRWVGAQEHHGIDGGGSGSFLIVDRTRHEVREEEVRSMCKLIEEVVIPLMTEETARSPNRRQRIVEAAQSAADKYIHA